MFNNGVGSVIAFIVGVIVGALGLWFYLRQQLEASKAHARNLQEALDDQTRKLEATQLRLQEREEAHKQAQARIEELNQTIQQLKQTVHEHEEQIKQMVPRSPDNLKRIEGIGPKTAAILQAAGITTFAQLAATSVSRLKEIIAEAGLSSLVNPSTWPEQAELAADDKWDELATLQDSLKGGRRQ